MTDCLFCKIALGELPADIVFQNEDLIAFRDVNPQAPVHVLIIPREHIGSFADAASEHQGLLGAMCLAAARVAAQEGIADSGFRTVVNNGEQALQSVRHLHMHVLGGRRMGWPPG